MRAMSKRTDVHRPSAINPSEYVFVALGYQGPSMGVVDEHRRIFMEHMKSTGGKFAHIERESGGCDVCGAACLYTARFYHEQSNTYITTGLDCAAKLDMGDAILFRNFREQVKAGLEAAAGKAKAQRILADAGLSRCWDIYTAEYHTLPRDRNGNWFFEENTIRDIVGKLVGWGSISEKQTDFLARLLTKIDERAARQAQREAEAAAAKPLPAFEGRVTVVGKVLTTKVVESPYGESIKMLVQHADGWKVWGSVPSNLPIDDIKGSTVQFDASIQKSDQDDKFGFFKRPSKASILTPGHALAGAA
jgi:hypothetical protein